MELATQQLFFCRQTVRGSGSPAILLLNCTGFSQISKTCFMIQPIMFIRSSNNQVVNRPLLKSVRMWFFFLINLFIYLFIYFWLCWILVSVRGLSLVAASGATLHRGARASHCRGLSCCGAQAPDAQAQQLWLTGLAAPRHVGSSQNGTRTRVPCIGRRIPNHCATREALECGS